MADPVLLDTHALLWWQADGRRLSANARRAIERADTLLVSPVSIWETGMLMGKGRVRLDRDLHAWTEDLYGDDRITEASLSPHGAAAAALLGEDFPGDPADRFLYATAQASFAAFVTKDKRIREYARVTRDLTTIW